MEAGVKALKCNPVSAVQFLATSIGGKLSLYHVNQTTLGWIGSSK